MSWAEVKKINSNFSLAINEMLYTNIFYPLLGMGTDGEFNSIGDVTPTAVDNIIMYECTDFTLNQGHTLRPTARNKAILIRCMGTCTINGTIDQRNNSMGSTFNATGTPWVNYTAVDLPPKYFLPLAGLDSIIPNRIIIPISTGGAGGAGGTGARWNNGLEVGGGLGSTAGAGGIGGTSVSLAFGGNAGGGGGGGGGGGTQYPTTTPVGGAGTAGISANTGVAGTGGAGGGWASNPTVYKGGTGGNGGNGAGNVIIIAKNIIIGSTGSILAYGTAGTAGTAGATNCGGGGGGGGGNGGSVALFYSNTYSKLGTINIAGGAGGAGGAKGSATSIYFQGLADGAKGSDGGAGTLITTKI